MQTPIWEGYLIMKHHFPLIREDVEEFFRQLAKKLPGSEPEIQSFDGISIDVLWENHTLSIIDGNYTITSNRKFRYFEQSSDALRYLVENLSKVK